MKRMFLISLVAGGLVLLLAATSMAVHKGAGELTCGACHTMHNSQGSVNNDLGGPVDGAIVLLRGNVTSRSEIHLLCLECHAENGNQGAQAQQPHGNTAPKVYRTTAWGQVGFGDIGAGGDFSSTGSYSPGSWTLTAADGASVCDTDASGGTASLGKGHSLGCKNVPPPGAIETPITEFTCTNCHDPHGARWDGTNWAVSDVNVYRNLKAKAPGGGGGMSPDPDSPVVLTQVLSYAGGVEAFVSNNGGGVGNNFAGAGSPTGANHYWPVYKSGTEQNAYYSGGTAGEADVKTTGIAGWCVQCHDKWHEDGDGTTNETGLDWRRHPVNNSIYDAASPLSGAGVSITDWGHYDTAISLPDKVPAAQNLAPTGYDGSGNNTYYANDSSDRVFCFSCHFVHGGPFYDNLRWDYTQSVATSSQTGNPIGSLVGCQQCHNRGGSFGS